jgi:porin
MRRLHSHSLSVAAILFAFGGLFSTRGFAQDTVKTYSGDFLTRSTLTGDWLGYRNDLLAKGITFDAYVTQVEQGVVSGGKNGSWEYGGRGDLTGNLDTGKAGLWPGGFLTAELEGNWESSVNSKTGALMAADTTQLFPVSGSRDVALSNLSFAQFLSHYIGFTLGKFDTIVGGDINAFAHGKGDSQFLNLAFNADPVLLVVPYSTLAAGALVLPTADPDDCILKAIAVSAKGQATTSGFDDFDGALFWSEIRKRIEVFDLLGHQLVGGLYSNRNYTSIDQRLGSIIGNQPIAKHDGTWAVYYNFDQYLYEPKKGVDQGVGVFGRFGASQGNPNPAQYFYSIGLGGKGFIPTREHDQAGLGYYYISVRNPTLAHPLGTTSLLRDEWGFEGYYNLALTPWLLLTPDVQVIGPSQKTKFVSFLGRQSIGTATVLGVRLQVLL